MTSGRSLPARARSLRGCAALRNTAKVLPLLGGSDERCTDLIALVLTAVIAPWIVGVTLFAIYIFIPLSPPVMYGLGALIVFATFGAILEKLKEKAKVKENT